MEQDIFIKYFTGKASPQEEERLLEWVSQSEANRNEYLEQHKVWDVLMLHREPEEPTIGFDQILNKSQNASKPKPTKKIIWLRELTKIAVVFVVAFGISWFLHAPPKQEIAYNTVEVPFGQRVKLTLPDGSSVWLNALTKLTYPAVFNEHERIVTLDGEGFFEITHHKDQPFKVRTPQHQVTVLGTTFNVYAYGNSPSFEATLIEGAVMVHELSHPEKQHSLKPGSQLFFDEENQQLQYQEVNPGDYTSWKDGLYCFNDISFGEMTKRLSHHFNTKIIINDESLLNYHNIYGKFRQNESITDVLDIIKAGMPFKYTYYKESNEIVIEK